MSNIKKKPDYKKITKDKLSNLHNNKIKKFEKYFENTNSILYKYQINSKEFIIKQSKKNISLSDEYKDLKYLSLYNFEHINTPNVYFYSEELNAYVMDFIYGEPMTEIFNQGNYQKLEKNISQLGKGLAEFHNCLNNQKLKKKISSDRIYNGMIRESKKNSKHLEQIINVVSKNNYVKGISHGDLDPRNIMISNERIYLIDISELDKKRFLLEDLGTMIAGMEKEKIRNFRKYSKKEIQILKSKFVNSYFKHQNEDTLTSENLHFVNLWYVIRISEFIKYQTNRMKDTKNIIKKIIHYFVIKQLNAKCSNIMNIEMVKLHESKT